MDSDIKVDCCYSYYTKDVYRFRLLARVLSRDNLCVVKYKRAIQQLCHAFSLFLNFLPDRPALSLTVTCLNTPQKNIWQSCNHLPLPGPTCLSPHVTNQTLHQNTELVQSSVNKLIYKNCDYSSSTKSDNNTERKKKEETRTFICFYFGLLYCIFKLLLLLPVPLIHSHYTSMWLKVMRSRSKSKCRTQLTALNTVVNKTIRILKLLYKNVRNGKHADIQHLPNSLTAVKADPERRTNAPSSVMYGTPWFNGCVIVSSYYGRNAIPPRRRAHIKVHDRFERSDECVTDASDVLYASLQSSNNAAHIL